MLTTITATVTALVVSIAGFYVTYKVLIHAAAFVAKVGWRIIQRRKEKP